jgi:hypothetical protein
VTIQRHTEADKVLKVLLEDFQQQAQSSTLIELKILNRLNRLFGPRLSLLLFNPVGYLKIMKAVWRDVREEMK